MFSSLVKSKSEASSTSVYVQFRSPVRNSSLKPTYVWFVGKLKFEISSFKLGLELRPGFGFSSSLAQVNLTYLLLQKTKVKNHSTQDSRVVPHRGTNWAALWLTAQIGRDAVLSESYGRG